MNKTMKNVMKPINPATIHANSEETKRQQENIVLAIMQDSPYSMTSRDIGNVIDPDTFPGYGPDRFWGLRREQRAIRIASTICKRLEAKGEIVSTLYQGSRLYSIPVGGETA